jgi:hypothetical protein
VPNDIRAPFLRYEQMRRRADDFLATHHPSRKLPVPIEEIIEFRLRINIVPVPGLRGAFDIDAFISSDCTEITVDQRIYNHFQNRYRFSLAHEIGHVVLHRDMFGCITFHSIHEWIAFITNLPEEQRQWIEYQAYCFGGLASVPSDQLEIATGEVIRKALESEIDIHPSNIAAWEHMVQYLANRFLVSGPVIAKQLRYEKIRTMRWLKSQRFL